MLSALPRCPPSPARAPLTVIPVSDAVPPLNVMAPPTAPSRAPQDVVTVPEVNDRASLPSPARVAANTASATSSRPLL